MPDQFVEQTESKPSMAHHVYEHDSRDSDSNGVENGRTHGTIGWVTPLIMIGFFLVATAIAIAHGLYCYFLDRKFVASTIPQSWNNAISVAFAHSFSTALAASASTAFTQLLWWYLRRRSLSLSKIDALFSLNSSPLNLYRVGILKAVPLLWFFGLLIPLISVATIFPPGSLVVQQLPDKHNVTTTVPTLNVDDRGNGSATDFFLYAMFSHGSDGEYRWPDVRYSSIGKRSLLQGSYLERPSPCGANCTYSLVFSAPSLRCEDDTPNEGLEGYVFGYYSNASNNEGAASYWDASGVNFMAAPYQLDDQFMFDISYWNSDTRSLKNISCTTLNSNYTAHISYENLVQSVTVEVTEGLPLNASVLSLSSLFYDVIHSEPTESGFKFQEHPYLDFTYDEIFQIFHGSQLRAMRDTLVRSLSGAISSFGTENYFTINTLMQEMDLTRTHYNETAYTYSNISFDLSAATVEDLMKNVTISILNDSNDDIDTWVTTIEYKSGYVFRDQARLIGAYAGALAACLAFILLGFGALLQNGTSATSGGFLQIMCTTTHGDGVMNRLAKEASLGDPNSIPQGLSDLKVRFGFVVDNASERRHAAFGTVEETAALVKSS